MFYHRRFRPWKSSTCMLDPALPPLHPSFPDRCPSMPVYHTVPAQSLPPITVGCYRCHLVWGFSGTYDSWSMDQLQTDGGWASCALKVARRTVSSIDRCRLQCTELVELKLVFAGVLLVTEVTGSLWTLIFDSRVDCGCFRADKLVDSGWVATQLRFIDSR